jgi:hypothetical protein
MSWATQLTEQAAAERMSASVRSRATAGFVLLVPLTAVLWLGSPLAGEITAAIGLALLLLFLPRALLIDGTGFRQLPLLPFPRRKVLWTAVDSFGIGYTRGFAYVSYAKRGRRARWWYPAGWPAQGSITPLFATRRGERALSAGDLCDLLNDRLAAAVRYDRESS